MTFGELINILGLQKSKQNPSQTKIEWIKFYFTEWELSIIYNDKKCNIARYRNIDGIFDGCLEYNHNYINIDDHFDKLEIIIGNYKMLFIDVFENKNFQINFRDSI